MGDLGLFFFLMSLNRKLRNQYFWRLKKIKLQLMQNRESFQTLDILFYSVFRITVNCGITAVNLNWKAFLIMHAWSVLDYRILNQISLSPTIHPSIHLSIHPTNIYQNPTVSVPLPKWNTGMRTQFLPSKCHSLLEDIHIRNSQW